MKKFAAVLMILAMAVFAAVPAFAAELPAWAENPAGEAEVKNPAWMEEPQADVVLESVVVEEKKAEEEAAPAEEAPAEEAPAEGEPAEEAPAEEKPAEEKPAGEKSAEEAPAEAQDDFSGFKDVHYVLYLGTNDAETNKPVFTQAEAMEVLKEILIRHFGGYTIQEASGGWIDDGKLYQEYTMVIYLSDASLEAVHAAADEMVETFRQSSVLIEAIPTRMEFYSPAK